MSLYTATSVGIDCDTPVRANVTRRNAAAVPDTAHVHIGHGELHIFGTRETIVAFAHRLVAALAPVEAELSQERLVRDALGITLGAQS